MILQISNFLKDYSDYVVLPLSVIAAALVAYWIYSKQKKIKKINYEYISNSNIISVDSQFKEAIEFRFNGERIEKLWLIIIKFTNTGNTPIEARDFEGGIKIKSKSLDKILSHEVIDVSPKNLNVKSVKHDDHLELMPCLMNPQDHYSLKILVNEYEPTFDINSRISGIKSIKEGSVKPKISMGRYLSGCIRLVFLLIIPIAFAGGIIVDLIGFTEKQEKMKLESTELLNNKIHWFFEENRYEVN